MVISRVINALARALLVAVLVAMPSIILPNQGMDTAQITVFTCVLASLFTFVEYFSRYPSIIEFRDAAPFNRMRFAMVFIIVVMLTAIAASQTATGAFPAMASEAGTVLGRLLDQPFSPVRLILIAVPDSVDLDVLFSVRDGAAMAYAVSLVGVGVFFLLVRVYDWPARNGAFNVWINLPLFDPTTGGDVVPRLRRDGYVNVILGALLPFFVPALATLAAGWFDVASLLSGQAFVWSITAWSFIPASMMMRGIAMCRIAELIEAKRQRAYARAAEEQLG